MPFETANVSYALRNRQFCFLHFSWFATSGMVRVVSRLRAGGLSGDAVASASPSESWAAAHCQGRNGSSKLIQNSACSKSSKATPPVANWPAMCRPAGGSTPPRRLTKRQPRVPTSLAFLQVYCKKARLASRISVAATRQTEKERPMGSANAPRAWGRRGPREETFAAPLPVPPKSRMRPFTEIVAPRLFF